MSRSQLIDFKNYCLDTQTKSYRNDCSTWMTKVVGK